MAITPLTSFALSVTSHYTTSDKLDKNKGIMLSATLALGNFALHYK